MRFEVSCCQGYVLDKLLTNYRAVYNLELRISHVIYLPHSRRHQAHRDS